LPEDIYCDALRAGLGSAKVSSDDHRKAAKELRSRLSARKFANPQGVDRLEKLLSKKSKIAYSGESASEAEIENIVLQARRFAVWAEESGRKLKIEGW
jgi:hypothetical protein